jgi:hypothetical protein
MRVLDQLRRDQARKKIKTMIERSDKVDLLKSMWVIDRARNDRNFAPPPEFDLPTDFIGATFGDQCVIHPWEVETLLTEILYWPTKEGDRRGNPTAWSFISTLTNALRKLENFEYGASGVDVIREVHRILYRQIIWQQKQIGGAPFVRWWSIISEPALAKIFEDSTGIELRKFIIIGSMWNVIFNRSFLSPRMTPGQIQELSIYDIDAFIAATSISLAAAQAEAKVSRSSSDATAYRKGILRRSPILVIQRKDRRLFVRPIETLLKWRISSGLYYDVIATEGARNIIGTQFEIYMRDLLKAKFGDLNVRPEFPYGTKKRPKKSPDNLLVDGDEIKWIIECKTAKIPYGVQTSAVKTADHDRVADDLAKGVAQVCAFEEDVAAGIENVSLRLAPDMVPIVVTLDDWLFFGPIFRDEIFNRAANIARFNGRSTKRIEARQVVLCSAAELEIILSEYDVASVLNLGRVLDPSKREHMTLSAFRELNVPMDVPHYPLSDRLDEIFAPFLPPPDRRAA